MKRSIVCTLIVAYFIVFIFPISLVAQTNEMKIIKIQGNKFAANMGSLHGISNGSIYMIIRNNKLIARAEYAPGELHPA